MSSRAPTVPTLLRGLALLGVAGFAFTCPLHVEMLDLMAKLAQGLPHYAHRFGQEAGFAAVQGARPRVVANAEELQAHAARVDAIRKKSGKSLWETPEATQAQDAA